MINIKQLYKPFRVVSINCSYFKNIITKLFRHIVNMTADRSKTLTYSELNINIVYNIFTLVLSDYTLSPIVVEVFYIIKLMVFYFIPSYIHDNEIIFFSLLDIYSKWLENTYFLCIKQLTHLLCEKQ